MKHKVAVERIKILSFEFEKHVYVHRNLWFIIIIKNTKYNVYSLIVTFWLSPSPHLNLNNVTNLSACILAVQLSGSDDGAGRKNEGSNK